MQNLMCLVAADLSVVISRSGGGQVSQYLWTLAHIFLLKGRETFSYLNESHVRSQS